MKTMLDQIDVSLTSGNLKGTQVDVWIVPVFKEEKISGELKKLDEVLHKEITKWSHQNFIQNDREKSSWLTVENSGLSTPYFLILNLGKKKDFTVQQARDAFGSAAKHCHSRGFENVGLMNAGASLDPLDCLEGFLLGAYKFSKYKSEKNAHSFLKSIQFFCTSAGDMKKAKAGLDRVLTLVRTTYLARDLVNEPANVINPDTFSKVAQKVAQDAKLKIKVIKGAELKKQNMNLLIAVAQGSANEPCLIHMEYKPKKKAKYSVALVGKGVTFDTGGLSLKTPQFMLGMKSDMAGAASVLGAIWGAAALDLPVHVHAIMAMVENMPSDRAIRPGDVVRGRSGKTVEIDNTDAEGRLILADALNYGEDLDVDYMIDVATLTGACVIALGDEVAAVYSTDDALQKKILGSSDQTGEKIWPMPLEKNYFSQMRSEIADMKNVGGREGGSITAALFLKEFVAKTKWAHLDIAGPSEAQKDWPTCPKGATGFPVRTFIQFLENL